ncbi:MAG: VCBS repeat-containing protein [Verrucomicrobia bacterium]|nr:VCBS repeat-containing protein [Verrucomicrobiota bacterium]MCF7708033.1 VCBS repeat-containing protein [Verrucomicrobiota bacterium]
MSYLEKLYKVFLCFCLCMGHGLGDSASANAVETPWVRHTIDDSSRGADGVKVRDVNGDGLLDITTGWEEGGVTRVYIHPGYSDAGTKWPAVTVGKTPSVEDAVFCDLNADGAVDVVSSCEGNTRCMFVHLAPEDFDMYLNPQEWETEPLPDTMGQAQWMFAIPLQVDNRNGPDLVIGSKGENASVDWIMAPGKPENLDQWHRYPISQAGWIMSLIGSDIDADGDNDIILSDRRGQLRGVRWLENPGENGNRRTQWQNHFIGGRDLEVMFIDVADMNADGLDDVVVTARRRHLFWFERISREGARWRRHNIPFPGNMGYGKAVAVGDINKDGLPDIVITGAEAAGKSGVKWLENESGGKWRPHEISGIKGIKFDRIELFDLDGDIDLDVLTCEEREGGAGLGVIWYENPLTTKSH